MKSLYSIQLDYQRALRQAGELEDLARQLNRQADSEFPGIIQNVKSAWQGDNANEYVAKANKLPGQIRGSATDLNNIAGVIRTVARNTYNAEMEAYRIAQERGY